MSYDEFIKNKQFKAVNSGFECNVKDMPDQIKDFQRDIVKWACKKGKAAIFADTGLGKTLMQITWAKLVANHNNGRVLILAPLCVAQQTVDEGLKFGIDIEYVRDGGSSSNIQITNYEMLKNFSYEDYCGIVLDESSILKGVDGKLRRFITDFGLNIPYRLSCTATPSPNDFMELGTQSEFLGVMSQVEMLATFFIHDGSDTSKWRLKGHGRFKFWEWLATWSCFIRLPSDLGYECEGYDLPPLTLHEHIVESGIYGDMFVDIAQGLQERNNARRETISQRCEKAKSIIDEWDSGIAWCNLNDESSLIAEKTEAHEVFGSQTPKVKEDILGRFSKGEIKKLVTKPKIAGFGLNWQHCNKMVFVGLSDSFEAFYQAVRRCWRFGQIKPVDVHIVVSDREGAVLDNIKRKQAQHDQMSKEMANIMREFTKKELSGFQDDKDLYEPQIKINIPNFINEEK